MAKKAYSLKIRDAEVMLSGLKSQKDKISNRGISDEYIKKFEELYAEAVRINGIQEKAKADLMTLTKQLDDQLTKVNKELRYCKNMVRTDMPTESFSLACPLKPENRGIQDSRRGEPRVHPDIAFHLLTLYIFFPRPVPIFLLPRY